MTRLTPAEVRGLQAISTATGRVLIVAADQRNGMRSAVGDAPGGPESIGLEQLAEIKSDLVRHLGNHAPAILLDPEVALPGVVERSVLGRSTALVVGMDASGYEQLEGLRFTRFVAGVTPRRVRDLGGAVAKMLYYTRPDRQPMGSRVWQDVARTVAACEAEGLLLIVELLTYRLEGESEDAYRGAFSELVAQGAGLAVQAGAKILKLQYPGGAEECRAVTRAAQDVPWAVLSAGVDHAAFLGQVRTALENGACGAMAGRALWKDSLSIDPRTRGRLLTDRALPRLRELTDLVDAHSLGDRRACA